MIFPAVAGFRSAQSRCYAAGFRSAQSRCYAAGFRSAQHDRRIQPSGSAGLTLH